MESVFFVLKINPSYLHLFKFLLEGADHLASVTVIEGKKGLVEISFHPKNQDLIIEILNEINKMFSVMIVSPDKS